MSRDWDKLRRQDKAKAPLSQSQVFGLRAARKHSRSYWRKKNRGSPSYPISRTPRRKYQPIIERELTIEGVQGTSRAIFRRAGGTWHCVSVNNPSFEWFLRIRNLDKIRQWLLEHHYSYNWLRSERQTCSAEEHSTDPMPNRHCGVSSLNNQPRSSHGNDQTPARPVLARNGVTTSSPINPEGCPSNHEILQAHSA